MDIKEGDKVRIILASNSPRRKELLSSLFENVEYMPQNVDEHNVDVLDPTELVKTLAEKKLNGLNLKYTESLIISADTIVYYNGVVYGKPKDENDALRILKELTGKMHYVYTGVSLAYAGKIYTFYDESKVFFKDLTETELVEYIKKYNPLDKAGAYGVQDKNVVDYYEGSYTNIVGLPMEKLKNKLIEIGVIR